jgi:ComF family protein
MITPMKSPLDLLFPRECAFCEGDLAAGDEIACGTCDGHVEWVRGAACTRCGAGLERDGAECPECEGKKLLFEAAVACGRYAGWLRELVHRFKFHRQLWLARPFADRLAERITRAGWVIDVVVPVPARPLKVLWQGRLHGAAETLAERLAGRLKRPLAWALTQVRETKPQAALKKEERLENPKGAYRAKKAVDGKAVLLVDDVMTTGATANDCSRALLEAGARRVHVAVIGR